MITDICFFNHWHYGDLFTTRGLVKDISQQLPDITVGYAHRLNPIVVSDFTNNYESETRAQVLNGFDMMVPMVQNDNLVLINTWVGNYQANHFADNKHPSYLQHYDIFAEIYQKANSNFGWNLQMNADKWHYVPEIDYTKLDLTAADEFLAAKSGKLYLFSNGQVQSQQSSLQHINPVIDALADQYPEDTFLATEVYVTSRPNVVFTKDIFDASNDLREISYLSSHADLIVGRNSGPFTYANTKSNLQDAGKVFMCYSHDARDVLPYGMDIAADFRFSDVTDSAQALTQIIQAITDIKQDQILSGFRIIE
jgi:hypothetical protein